MEKFDAGGLKKTVGALKEARDKSNIYSQKIKIMVLTRKAIAGPRDSENQLECISK